MAEFNFKKLSLLVLGGSLVVAGGVVGASALLRSPAINLKSDTTTTNTVATEKTITVKGVAEKEIISDMGSMDIYIYFNAKNKETGITDGYKQIKENYAAMLDQLKKIGLSEKDLENIRIDYEQVDKYVSVKEGDKTISKSEFQHYRFSCRCRIVSSDVKAVEKASVELYNLIENGIEITLGNPQFFVNDLEQYKLELVDSATASAYQRAETLASKSGAQLGPLLTARQGVIQITRTASNETSDYGVYDTTSIKKVMRLVVTSEFSLKK